jgi:opacity protein-like surface antigen
MKKFALFCITMLLFAGIASAQDTDSPKVEVFGGYSYVRFNPGMGAPGDNFNGGTGSVSFNPNSWLGLVGDFGGYHWSQGSDVAPSDVNVFSYLFGPKIAFRSGRFTPFAQVLFGAVHSYVAGGPSENAFAMAMGGGADWNFTDHLGIRLIQADYLMTRFGFGGPSYTQNSARISTGVVLRW